MECSGGHTVLYKALILIIAAKKMPIGTKLIGIFR